MPQAMSHSLIGSFSCSGHPGVLQAFVYSSVHVYLYYTITSGGIFSPGQSVTFHAVFYKPVCQYQLCYLYVY